MGYRMKVDLPNRPEGAEITITGLGAFKNGKTYDIDDEQAERFRRIRGRVVDDVDAEGNRIGNKWEPGPPLSELTIHGITVEKSSAAPESGSSKPNDAGPTGNVKVQSGEGSAK